MIRRRCTRPWSEHPRRCCGGQTHAIVRFGLDELLPKEITLIHGPGCPVCVTPIEILDKAVAIAARPEVVFCSFGDMLRVPGSSANEGSLDRQIGRGRRPDCLLAHGRLGDGQKTRTGRSFSSPSVLRPRPRQTQWRWSKPPGWA